ncbi:MAG: helicase-related protein, partial [Thermoleophilaceae bacterium]
QAQRQKALARFESGAVDTLVATDVAARGIDVADITHVINFDVPEDRDGYVHRIGRTARAGATGAGVNFVMADQAHDMRRIAADLGLTAQFDERRPGGGEDSSRNGSPSRTAGSRGGRHEGGRAPRGGQAPRSGRGQRGRR